MSRTDMHNWQDVQDSDLNVIGLQHGATDEEINSRVNKDLNVPFRLYESFPTPDSKLNIGPSVVKKGSGASQTISPVEDLIPSFAGASIDYHTGVVVGGILLNGGVFTPPAGTAGYFVRHVFSFIAAQNQMNSTFSLESSTLEDLENAGSAFARIDGAPQGWINLECLGLGKYKSAGASSEKIYNEVNGISTVFRFGAGSSSGGGGGGEDTSFKVQSVTGGGVVQIKKGAIALSDGRELLATDDISFDASGYPNGSYYCYIDTATLASSTIVNGRVYYLVNTFNLVLLTATPESANLIRYVPLGTAQRITGVWQNSTSYPPKRHNVSGYALKVSLPSGEIAQIITAGKTRTVATTVSALMDLLPISHNFVDVPVLKFQVEETADSGKYTTEDDSAFFSVTDTQIIAKTALTDNFDGATIVRLTYAVGEYVTGGNGVWETRLMGATNTLYANPYDEVVIDTTGNSKTVWLPGSPLLGCRVKVLDYGSTWTPSKYVTVKGNGKLIGGATQVSFSTAQMSIELVYNGTYWNYSSGLSINKSVAGTTGERPTAPQTGEMYFDTTLGTPIWRGVSGWVDASGTQV